MSMETKVIKPLLRSLFISYVLLFILLLFHILPFLPSF